MTHIALLTCSVVNAQRVPMKQIAETRMFSTISHTHRVAVCPSGAKSPTRPVTDVTGPSKQCCCNRVGRISDQYAEECLCNANRMLCISSRVTHNDPRITDVLHRVRMLARTGTQTALRCRVAIKFFTNKTALFVIPSICDLTSIFRSTMLDDAHFARSSRI